MKNPVFYLLSLLVIVCTACSGSDKNQVSAEDSIRIAREAVKHARISDNRTDTVYCEKESDAPRTNIPETKFLTQYCFVEVTDRGPELRGNLTSLLKNLGFRIKEGYMPPCLDSPDETEYFGNPWNASRKSSTGVTKIECLVSDVRQICTIDFADQAEFARFRETVEKTNYVKKGNAYHHKSNGKAGSYIKTSITIVLKNQSAEITQRQSVG